MLKKSTCTRFFWVQKPGFFGFSGSGSGSGTRFFRVFGFEFWLGYENPNMYPKPAIFGFQCMHIVEYTIYRLRKIKQKLLSHIRDNKRNTSIKGNQVVVCV